jgi:muconolactone delta-isomerase
MLFLVELDHVKSGAMPTPETGRAFIEQIIFPTLERAGQLAAEKKILAGGPVLGRIALRFIVQADSSEQVDQIVTSLPLWPLAETRVTPLISFGERRTHVQALLEGLAARAQSK